MEEKFLLLDKQLNDLIVELAELNRACVEADADKLKVLGHLNEIGFVINDKIHYEITKIKELI